MTVSENARSGPDLPPRLRIEGLSKTFGSARVLRDAGLTVQAGQIHGLIGANGSGKSTLVKCITGVYAPDSGALIEIGGRPVPRGFTPKLAAEVGVRVVHQEAPLIDSMTLADFVALHRGFVTRARAFIDRRRTAAQTRDVLDRLDIQLPAEALASRLKAAERAMVMLAVAVADVDRGGRLVVLDEATASIPAEDAKRFLDAVRQAADVGVGVLLVTHRLQEVLGRCSHVTALRDGEVVLQTEVHRCTHGDLVDAIIGLTAADGRLRTGRVRRSDRFAPPASRKRTESPTLEVRGLTGDTLCDVSLDVAAGEILGVSGIVGSGAAELGTLLSGAQTAVAGEVAVVGVRLPPGFGPRQSQAAGIAYVPGDRLREGGIPSLSVRENICLADLRRYWRHRAREHADVNEVIKALDVRPPEPERSFGTLSGGNQQKVIIGKWALRRPRVFVLDDPTAGVDPGAREEIYAVLRGLKEAGTSMVVISSEPEQLVQVADRVLVVRDGRLSRQLTAGALSERSITAASQ